MRHPLITILLLAGYFTGYFNCVLADTSLYYSEPQSPSSFSVQIKAGHLRIEDFSQNTRTTSLIDVEKNLLIIIDHANKEYRELTANSLAQESSAYTTKLVKLQAQINHELEQLQATARLLVDEEAQTFMASVATPQFYAATNKLQHSSQVKKHYNGHCEVQQLTRADKNVAQVCIIQPSMTLLSEAEFSTFNTWLMFNQQVASTVNAELTALSHSRFYNFNKLQGLPLEISDLQTGRQLVLDYMSDQRLSEGLFQVPYGYQIRPTVIDGFL